MVAKVSNYMLVCYCGYVEIGCDPKMGGAPPGGLRFWRDTSLGYKWLQKLIIICWYGYCGYGQVDNDPKTGGGHLLGGPQS